MTNQNNSLKALTTAALAIPSMAQQTYAAGPVEDVEADFRYSYYHENGDRYDINVHEAEFAIPLSERVELDITVGRDIMSGATPVFYLPSFTAPGQANEVRSAATISEERNYISAAGTYFLDEAQYTLGGAYSSENDYESLNINTEGQWHFNKKNTTVTAGIGFSDDKIRPIQEIREDRPLRESGGKSVQDYLIGITQTIDKNSSIQQNVQFSIDTGLLSDPYKTVWVTGNTAPDGSFASPVASDNRPGRREAISLLTRYVRYLPKWESSVHVDYRFHYNDWNIRSHTLETTLYQPIGKGWEIVPSLRYYTQTHAEFYSLLFAAPRADGFRSSDYRLAAFGSIAGGLKLKKEFTPNISANIVANYEARHKRFKLGGKASPSGIENEKFTKLYTSILAAGLQIKF